MVSRDEQNNIDAVRRRSKVVVKIEKLIQEFDLIVMHYRFDDPMYAWRNNWIYRVPRWLHMDIQGLTALQNASLLETWVAHCEYDRPDGDEHERPGMKQD